MKPPALGRAQLLRILTRLPRSEWEAAAAAAGFEPRARRRRAKGVEPGTGRAAVTGGAAEGVAAAPAAYALSDLPDLPFWRVAAERPLGPEDRPTDAPRWLERTRPWAHLPQSDPARSVPQPAPLAPPARQARFLRQVLAAPVPGGALDLERLCRQLAEGRIASRLPRLSRPVRVGRLRLVMDLSPGLRPMHTDLWRWARQLEEILGGRVTRLLARSGHPGELELADIGCEHAVWNHPAVVADELACALRPEHRADAERAFAGLPAELRRAMGAAREAGNRHLSPLVQWEEALSAGAQGGGTGRPTARRCGRAAAGPRPCTGPTAPS